MIKSGSAPGFDGITSEHLKFALQSPLHSYLAVLLILCFRFGVVPDSFFSGLLVSIMKKANLDLKECKSCFSYNCVNCDVKNNGTFYSGFVY